MSDTTSVKELAELRRKLNEELARVNRELTEVVREARADYEEQDSDYRNVSAIVGLFGRKLAAKRDTIRNDVADMHGIDGDALTRRHGDTPTDDDIEALAEYFGITL